VCHGQAAVREEIAKERAEMLSEIGRLDGELEAARETVQQGRAAVEAERQAHEQTRSDARRAQAVADERDKRIAALETELRGEREARAPADQALTAPRVEAATLAERAAHVDELRQVLRSLQGSKGREGEAARKPRRQTKPEG
jgi:chromosome segregation ATPase